MSLDFQCNMQRLESECGVNNMKAGWWCNDEGDIFLAHYVYPFMTTMYSSTDIWLFYMSCVSFGMTVTS